MEYTDRNIVGRIGTTNNSRRPLNVEQARRLAQLILCSNDEFLRRTLDNQTPYKILNYTPEEKSQMSSSRN